eukprot:m51a1_g3589 hypothetical protein (1286) ;mRNA; f:1155521-1162077
MTSRFFLDHSKQDLFEDPLDGSIQLYDNTPACAEVLRAGDPLPGCGSLLIGPCEAARCPAALARSRVTHVVCLDPRALPDTASVPCEVLAFDHVADSPRQALLHVLAAAVSWASSARAAGGNVLVASRAGMLECLAMLQSDGGQQSNEVPHFTVSYDDCEDSTGFSVEMDELPSSEHWWEAYKRELSDAFMGPRDLIRSHTREGADFWDFLAKYESASSRQPRTPSSSPPPGQELPHWALDLPKVYDARYRVGFALVHGSGAPARTPRGLERVPSERLATFRTALHMYADFCMKRKFQRLVKLRRDRAALPIAAHRDEILAAVASNSVTVVAGDTGCGKSTQVPQYLLEAGYSSIACTQPRRIACISLCRRVAVETLNEYGSKVAYQIRFDSSTTAATRIVFLTEGVLLRQVASQALLERYDVVIVDEVHERHLFGDFLLGILRDVVGRRAGTLKLVLMSATINVKLYSDYFCGAPVILVPGRLFPIEVRFFAQDKPTSGVEIQQNEAEESQKPNRATGRLDCKPYLAILDMIEKQYPADERGDVLIFMSGMREILTLAEEVRREFGQRRKWIILVLHSAISVEEQDKVFDIAPDGVRKCIISTNIAETSVTIDGIRFVIDSGKVKEMGYDARSRMQQLQEFWISQASAEQRKGRSGRTGPGVCFRIYSPAEYAHFNKFTVPEILRVPLQSLVLQILALNLGDPRAFSFIEMPPKEAVEEAVRRLVEIDAIRAEGTGEVLTPLGEVLSRLPVDPPLGKVLVLGSTFGLSAIAALDSDDGKCAEHEKFVSPHGDPFTLLNLYDEWISVKSHHGNSRRWCREHFVEEQRLYEITKLADQFKQQLDDARSSGDEDQDSRRSRKRDRRELRVLRIERDKKRKRRVLTFEDDATVSDGEKKAVSDEEVDLREIDFNLTHSVDEMFSGLQRRMSLRDAVVVKFIVSSGLYPNVAIPDPSAPAVGTAGEVTFHTRFKDFVGMHPLSVFAAGRGGSFSMTDAFFYVTLLHTNKTFIVGALRMPAVQSLLLLANRIDTDRDCTKLVVDQWLEFKMANYRATERILSLAHELREAIIALLQKKLKPKTEQEQDEGEAKMATGHPAEFLASFMGCFDDMESCMCSTWCPCVQYGRNTEEFGRGVVCESPDSCLHCLAHFALHSFTGCGCLLIAAQRQLVREKYGISGDFAEDLLLSWCCGCCVLSQVSREIKQRRRLIPPPTAVYISYAPAPTAAAPPASATDLPPPPSYAPGAALVPSAPMMPPATNPAYAQGSPVPPPGVCPPAYVSGNTPPPY